MTTDDKTQVNGTPTPQQQVAQQFQAACHAYATALALAVQQQGGQINPLELMVNVHVLTVRIDVLLAALQHCAATGEGFDLARYDATVVANVQARAQQLAQPKILLASGGRG